jgi:hypothetical protein
LPMLAVPAMGEIREETSSSFLLSNTKSNLPSTYGEKGMNRSRR